MIISILVACEEVFFNYFLSILGRYEFAIVTYRKGREIQVRKGGEEFFSTETGNK